MLDDVGSGALAMNTPGRGSRERVHTQAGGCERSGERRGPPRPEHGGVCMLWGRPRCGGGQSDVCAATPAATRALFSGPTTTQRNPISFLLQRYWLADPPKGELTT